MHRCIKESEYRSGSLLPSWRKTRSSKLMRSLRSRCRASMEVTMSLFPSPCMEDSAGTLGAHALALLKMLAEYAVAQGCYSSPDRCSPLLTPPMQVSLWMQRWQQRLSTWLHFPSRFCAFTGLHQGFSLQASSSATRAYRLESVL